MSILMIGMGAVAGLTVLLMIGLVYDMTHEAKIKPYDENKE